ncbi:MAG: ABC transporter ATP-binding protein [Candidatus Thermoplasmatota archaeon]|nr:ABC transporter ATP-binding protein [Candidatus Thermoplasmatota archaeon]
MGEVRIKELIKRFENVAAVNRVSIDCRDGEFLVLLGPSGCGKTTILRTIAGLEEPTEGEIYIDNKLVNDIPPKDRGIAMVFQNYALYPHMTVRENIAFPLKMKKMKKEEIDDRVQKVAKMLEIEKLLDRKPKELSGGQRQRVALGRAVVRNPKVFLMDEPLSNLDAKLRTYMRAELKKLHERIKVTTVYVTHDQVEAMTMATRIALLKEGELQQIGTPSEIYNNPANTFVGGFVGTPPMNFIEGSAKGKTFVSQGIEYDLPGVRMEKEKVILGIRPEDVKISEDGNIEGEVYVVEPLGSEQIITIKIGEALIIVKTSPDTELKVGEKVKISFNPQKIHLFDGETLCAI